MAGTQELGPPSAAFRGALAVSWIGIQESGTPVGTLARDAGVLSGDLACCSTTPAPIALL